MKLTNNWVSCKKVMSVSQRIMESYVVLNLKLFKYICTDTLEFFAVIIVAISVNSRINCV